MSFPGEIKRRKGFQVAALCAVMAWLIIQVIGLINDPLKLPEWLGTVVIVLLAVGFSHSDGFRQRSVAGSRSGTEIENEPGPFMATIRQRRATARQRWY